MEVENMMELFALIIFVGLLITKVSKIVKLPDVVLFIFGGVLLGPSVLNWINIDAYSQVNDLILTFGAAYILFDGGKEIHLTVLHKIKLSLTLLATVGVIITTFIMGYFVSVVFHIDFRYGLLIGSVIASTDPSVLVPLFKRMSISNKLKQFIIAESAFNDAAGAIITFAVLGVILGGQFSLLDSTQELILTAIGGIGIGLIIGYIATILISHPIYGFLKEYAAEIGIVAVAAAYVISEKVGVSGFMAVFMMGIICGNKSVFKLKVELDYTHFKEVLVLILRMMIFILLGTKMDLGTVTTYWKESLFIVFLLMFVARPISVLLTVPYDRKASWTWKEILYLMWIRETGVIPAALAGMLISMKVEHSDIISAVTFATIIITLSIQASTAQLLARWLGLEVISDTQNKSIEV